MNQYNFDKDYEQYLGLIYGAIKSLNIRIKVDHDELIQVGLFALYEAMEKYDSKRLNQFEPYAYFIIKNRLKNELTKRNNYLDRFAVTEDELLNLHESPDLRMTEGYFEENYLHVLTEKQKAVVIERYLNNRSVKETAKVLGITEDSVKNRARDARKALIKHLGEK